MPALVDLTGQIFGSLVVTGRAPNTQGGRVRWYAQCHCGNPAIATTSHLKSGHTSSCGCYHRRRASEANTKPDDEIGYYAAHQRVYRSRGSAADFFCVDCGGPGEQWSLDKEALITFRGMTATGSECLYSPDPSDYEPRCRNCHAAYDRTE